MKGNVIRLNIMHLNSVHLNSIGEVQSVSLKAGESTEDPVYPPTTYTLAANVSNGKVTATKNGTAISLPYVATEGDVIVLSVTPDEGYEFKGWLDGNKSNPRTVTMTGNVVLSASCVEIAKPTYTLSASVTNGKVSAKRNGSAVNLPYTANEGDVIVVEITPNDGYTFEGWTDGNTDNPRSITMTADVALSAQCVEVVQPPVGNYIQFEDAEVERVLMSKGVSSDGVGITIEDAERVTSIGTWFLNNTTIVSFNELRYFTALTEVSPLNEGGYGASAFRGATNLREITIPRNVSRIGTHCFSKCSSLVNVTFEDANKITDINSNAFADCSALVAEVDFPNLSVLGANAFGKCSSLTKVVSLGNVSILYGSSTTGMTQGEFYGCTSLSEINLPSSLASIGINSFRNCSGLARVICRATTPPSLANVSAFTNTNNCPIYVPDASLEAYRTATNWNSYADRIHPLSEIEGSPYIQFEDAEAERVLMANGVSSDGIGITKEDAAAVTSLNAMFNGNSAITSFDELRYFTGLTTLSSDTPATYVGEFYNCTNLQRVTIPANVSKVLNYTFYMCTSLQSVTFEDASRITELGQHALSSTAIGGEIAFPNLENAISPFHNTSIEKALDLGKITKIEGVSSGYASSFFDNSASLKILYLPATLTALNGFAIGRCSALTTVVCLATTPPTLSSAAFNGCSAITGIYVPDASVDAYKASWSTHASKIKPLSELNA